MGGKQAVAAATATPLGPWNVALGITIGGCEMPALERRGGKVEAGELAGALNSCQNVKAFIKRPSVPVGRSLPPTGSGNALDERRTFLAVFVCKEPNV